jgi:uncharacterized membrane protein/protein-disulfide isomerase
MTKRAAALCLLCAAVGFGVSAAAAYTHYHLLNDPNYRSFCDVNETVSCTQVYMSRFSTVNGVPVAIFGALWFVVAGLLSVAGFTARDSVRESVPGYLFVMSTMALAVVLYLGYASFFLLKAVCLLCLTTYAAVIGLFLVSGAATSYPMTTLPRRFSRDLRVLVSSPLAIAVAVLFFAGAASTLAFFPREGAYAADGTGGAASASQGGAQASQGSGQAAQGAAQDQQSELQRFMATAPRVPLIVPAEGAKVLIVKFNDFECPACGQSYLQYKPILAKYQASNPGAVRMVLKDYPLNPGCNPGVAQVVHQSACDAAVAVRLARAHNKEEAMEDWLYTHQSGMTPSSVRQAAKDVGGITDFDAQYAAAAASIKADAALGKQLAIKSTPTFFINGVKVEGMWAPQFFDQAIAFELKRAATK